MMLHIISVGIGGLIGSILRYITSLELNSMLSETFIPLGTLLVNVVGSFLLGFIMQIAIRMTMNPYLKLFLTTGIMGGLTTFSTMSYETFALITHAQYLSAFLNIMLNVVLGLSASFGGSLLATILL
ncbi:MAG: fluoride efflux transporter CrcB [Fervidobacterium sp.]